MRRRFIYGAAGLVLAILLTVLVWQGSFSFGDFGPTTPQEIFLFWAVSIVIFIPTVALGFILFRNLAKLYIDKQSNREGSRIRTKLVAGAILLSITPVVFLVMFSITILNVNVNKWFSRPSERISSQYAVIGNAIERVTREKAQEQVNSLAERMQHPTGLNEARNGCLGSDVHEVFLAKADGSREELCYSTLNRTDNRPMVTVEAPLTSGDRLVLRSMLPLDLADTKKSIDSAVERYNELHERRHEIRRTYLYLLLLITIFVLFVATWIAQFLAKQISIPISALLRAAHEVRGGNLGYRIRVGANDELATLVRAFNDMTHDLEASSNELETRRRFTEAILESIPTGVISLAPDGSIQRINRALKGILPADQVEHAAKLDQLFTREEMKELRYVMNRARRIGMAATQFDKRCSDRTVPLSITAAALAAKGTSGYVLVIEDTSDLLRAQKSEAWHEVARRIAHEIKNPLTPISLSAERIARYLDRPASEDTRRVLGQCSATIASEVECLKSLVNEFSQFARFPAGHPSPSDLNDIVENALGLFTGRLDGISVKRDLAEGLPLVNIDRDQFKRVVVNLVDNAAEAMQDSLVKVLYIQTSAPAPDMVELVIADTGCGVSPEDKQKLFLPYFSTKGRGTGLGLAIVSHIISEHNGHIRVEENRPSGARFIIDIPVATAAEADVQPPVEVQA